MIDIKIKKNKFTLKKTIVSLLFLFAFVSAVKISAQNTQIDEPQQPLKIAKIDTQLVINNIKYADSLLTEGYHDSAITILNNNLIIANKLNYTSGVANNYVLIGNAYLKKNDFTKAINYYSLAIQYFNALQNIKMSAHMCTNIGLAYKKQSKYTEALQFYFLALKTHEKIKNKNGIGKAFNSIGVVYFVLEKYTEALSYFKKSLQINTELNDEKLIAQDYLNIANVLSMQYKFNEALNLYSKSLKIKENLNDDAGVALLYDNIASTYYDQKNYNKALDFYLKALQIYTLINDEFKQSISNTNIANAYIALNNINKAHSYINKSITVLKKIGSFEELKEAYLVLAKVDSSKGNFKQAYLNLKIYNAYKDSIFNDDLSFQLSELQTKYETQKKEQEIFELKQQQQINSLKLKQRNYAITSLLLIGLLTSISIVFFVKQQKQKRLLAIQQTEEKERRRLAKDIHDDLGSGLSKIKIISQTISSNAQNNPEILAGVTSISNTSISLVQNMRDLIWALNAENTTIQSLVAQIREYSSEYVDGTGKKIIYSIQNNLPDTKIETQVYRNIYFIVKEALQNIVKHSQATEIKLSISLNNTHLNIQIIDNGIGITQNSKNGNGLNNMKKRALLALSELTIDSSKNGTTISLNTQI